MDEQIDKTRYEAFREGKPPGITMISCGCKPKGFWEGMFDFWLYLLFPALIAFAVGGPLYIAFDIGWSRGYNRGYLDKLNSKGYDCNR